MLLIKENPLFGSGFFSYLFHSGNHPEMYQGVHSHNFAIESLLSFGVIGSVILLIFTWSYYSKVTECKELLRNNVATSLILPLSAAILIHSTTDITLLWINTGVLYALILGAIGIDEKALNKRILACAQKGGISDTKPHQNIENNH
jgi:O-antigen ligase